MALCPHSLIMNATISKCHVTASHTGSGRPTGPAGSPFRFLAEQKLILKQFAIYLSAVLLNYRSAVRGGEREGGVRVRGSATPRIRSERWAEAV